LKISVTGVDTVVHLAAVLPPESEVDQEKTFVVNIDAIKKIVEMLKPATSARIVFASFITTYGDTSGENPPITTSHPQKPVSI